MAFQPAVNEELAIEGVGYRVGEHPHAPGMVYGQEGRQAVVYQLVVGTEQRALKMFKPRYQVPALASLADRLAHFAHLPGLQVCRRTVLTASRYAALLRQYPDLTYAVLMPWIGGPTWMEIIQAGQPLAPEHSLVLARALVTTLVAMEEQGLAHCDLSGPNLLLPVLEQGTTRDMQHAIELVDVEQMYGAELRRPVLLTSGSAGYAHQTAADASWAPEVDRFAGAVLVAEMLGWCDGQVRAAAWGESYFDPVEMQQSGARYDRLQAVLQGRWGASVAGLFARAWESATLADCPTFGTWLVTLPEQVPAPAMSIVQPARADESRPDALNVLLTLARQLEASGNWDGALQTYRQAQMLLPAGSAQIAELAAKIRELESPPTAQPFTLPVPAPPPSSRPPAALSPFPAVPAPPQGRAPLSSPAPPGGLDQFFSAGQVAHAAGDMTRDRELLGVGVRQQPDYALDGRSASRLQEDTERREAPRRKGGIVWGGVVAGLLLVLLLMGSLWLAQGQAAANSAYATATAVAAQTATTRLQAIAAGQTAITQVQAIAAGETATTQTRARSLEAQTATIQAQVMAAGQTATAQVQSTIVAAQAATAQAQAEQATANVLASQAAATRLAVEILATAKAQAAQATTDALAGQATATTQAVAEQATAEAQAVQAAATAKVLAEQATETRLASARATTSAAKAIATTRSQATAVAQAQLSPIASAPVLLSPTNGVKLNYYPRTTTLKWAPVRNAVSYTVEIDCFLCCSDTQWCADIGQTWDTVPGLTYATYTFDFVGAQPGRWCVWAVDNLGRAGPKSGWWYFEYLQ